MDWGINLWDQFENVDKHHSYGIDFSEKYAKFVKDRCAIELEYAGKLKKLIKTYHPKKKDEDKSMFSTYKAFQNQLSELNDIAGQHELVAEEMLSNISKLCQSFCNELRTEKKKFCQDGRHHKSVLDQHERTLEQTKKKFEKEWKECERAQAYFEKLDADGNVTKADVEKAKNALMAKTDSVGHCKTDYGAILQQFNTAQDTHFQTVMPNVFQKYKEAEDRRILKTKEYMIEYAKIDSKVKPIIKKCLDGMEQAATAIDSKLDAQLVVEKLKSGFFPPSDKEFEDYTAPQQHRSNVEDVQDGSNKNSINVGKQTGRKGGLSRLFGQKKLPQPRGSKKRLPLATSNDNSFSDTDLSQVEVNSEKDENENNTNNSEDFSVEQRSRTISFPASKAHSVNINAGDHLSLEKRSTSVEMLPKGENAKTRSSKSKSEKKKLKPAVPDMNFRHSLLHNKKKIMTMFKSNKDEHVPKIEVSGPISCDMLGSGINEDYLVPIASSAPDPEKPIENPYDEVALSQDDTDDEVAAVESSDYSHLPPEQRRKKLQKIIDGLKSDINREEDGRKGIIKIQEAYRANPALGDANSLELQVKRSTAKMDKLQTDLKQYETWYADAFGSVQSSPARVRSQRALPHGPVAAMGPTISQIGENGSLEKDQSFGDDFDEETEPIGTCIALYDFEATSEGALSMTTGETFSVLEADNGDGWTRAMQNDIEGYVPTSYVEVTYFT